MVMKRAWPVLFIAVAALLAATEPALAAQCAMCKQALANSAQAEEVARGMNLAILVMLIPPVVIFAGIFGAFYRFRGVQGRKQIPR